MGFYPMIFRVLERIHSVTKRQPRFTLAFSVLEGIQSVTECQFIHTKVDH